MPKHNQKFRIGRHIGISYGFATIPQYARQIGCDIFQIFLGAPQRIITKAKQDAELIKFGSELETHDIIMVVHGSYTINLCHPTTSLKFKASVKALVQDLRSTALIGPRCLGVIIHMGKNIPDNKITDDAALSNYVMGLEAALDITDDSTTIILETGASQGSEVASHLDELSEIYWRVSKNKRHRIKFCIDTCHIWASGYDISNKKLVGQFFKEFNDKIGIENINCIHFNDSKTPLNSNVDRHADLGYGYIKLDGLRAVFNFAKKHHIPIITETPLDAVNPKTNRNINFKDEMDLMKSWL